MDRPPSIRIMIDAIAYDEAVIKLLEDAYQISIDQGMSQEEAILANMVTGSALSALRVLLFGENEKTEKGGQKYAK